MSCAEHIVVCRMLRDKSKKTKERRLMDDIRENTKKIRRFYHDFPFCTVCKCRAPLGHTDHIFEPMNLSED